MKIYPSFDCQYQSSGKKNPSSRKNRIFKRWLHPHPAIPHNALWYFKNLAAKNSFYKSKHQFCCSLVDSNWKPPTTLLIVINQKTWRNYVECVIKQLYNVHVISFNKFIRPKHIWKYSLSDVPEQPPKLIIYPITQ